MTIMTSRRRFLAFAAATGVLPRLAFAGQSEDGFTVLRATKASKRLMGGDAGPAEVWGYDGIVPGPTLRVRQGEELKVRLINELDQPTLIHWHGVRLPNAMDGTVLTQAPVEPGSSFDYVFVPPDAGTFWYHPHIRSSQQVDRGLHGALIVEEREPSGVVVDDLLMVLDDWKLKDDGSIDTESYDNIMIAAHAGRIGNWFTVNGASRPKLKARADRPVRLRLINAANAMIMALDIKGPDAELIAIDGQPVEPRGPGEEPLELGSGGRFDLLLPPSAELTRIGVRNGGETLEVAYVDRTGGPGAEPGGRFILPANPLPNGLDLDDALAVDLVMEGGAMGGLAGAMHMGAQMTMRELVGKGMVWAFNGVAGMPETPLFGAERDRVVTIRMVNRTAWRHSMHIHGHHFRVVARDGEALDDPIWRDIVIVDPRKEVTITFKADNPGKWMLHCHVYEHQETGMMSWFEVA